MSEDDDSVFAALRAGARGYLLKESEGAEHRPARCAPAARSEAVFGPRIADRVLAFFASSRGRASAVPFPELTDREREVLDLVAHGLPNAAIATRLFLSEKTVRNRVSDVLTKLHAASRAEAVALARDAGLGPAADRGLGPAAPGAAGAARRSRAGRRPGRAGAPTAAQVGRADEQRHPEDGDGEGRDHGGDVRRRGPSPARGRCATRRPVTSTDQTSSACPPRRAAPPRASSATPAAEQQHGDGDQQHPRGQDRGGDGDDEAGQPDDDRAGAEPRARAASAGPRTGRRATSRCSADGEEEAERAEQQPGPGGVPDDGGDGDGDHRQAEREPLRPGPPGLLGGRHALGACGQDAGCAVRHAAQCPSPGSRARQAARPVRL